MYLILIGIEYCLTRTLNIRFFSQLFKAIVYLAIYSGRSKLCIHVYIVVFWSQMYSKNPLLRPQLGRRKMVFIVGWSYYWVKIEKE